MIEWDPVRLAAACDSVQDQYRRGIELPMDDPRNDYVTDVLVAGTRLVEDLYIGSPDAQVVIWRLDELSPDALRVLAFERLWREGLARERDQSS